MFVVLVNTLEPTEIRLPQGLLYLASATKARGHRVEIHDELLEEDLESSLQALIDRKPEMVGICVYSNPFSIERARAISKRMKEVDPKVTIVWGGWHVTKFPKQSVSEFNVDYIVRGPAEKTFPDLLDRLGEERPVGRIAGVMYNSDTDIVDGGEPVLESHDMFPPLDFSLVNVTAYLLSHDRAKGTLQYITSRGCTGRCAFCCMASLFRGKVFVKPREQVVKELGELLKTYPVESLSLSDDNAFRSDSEALRLAEMLEECLGGRPIHWRCATRVDTLFRLSRETLCRLRETGCSGFAIGVESGVQRVLDLMRKGYKATMLWPVLQRLKEVGFDKNLIFLMLGFPGEIADEAQKTLKTAERIRILMPTSDISIVEYIPMNPGDNGQDKLSVAVFTASDARRPHSRNGMGKNISIARHYIVTSRAVKGKKRAPARIAKGIQRTLAMVRIRYGFYSLPLEFHLSKWINHDRGRTRGSPKSLRLPMVEKGCA